LRPEAPDHSLTMQQAATKPSAVAGPPAHNLLHPKPRRSPAQSRVHPLTISSTPTRDEAQRSRAPTRSQPRPPQPAPTPARPPADNLVHPKPRRSPAQSRVHPLTISSTPSRDKPSAVARPPAHNLVHPKPRRSPAQSRVHPLTPKTAAAGQPRPPPVMLWQSN